jgi:polysaccharide export outer membrane protein
VKFIRIGIAATSIAAVLLTDVALAAQAAQHAAVTAPAARVAPSVPDYIIGPDDVLSIVFWRDKDMSGDVVVRPDGKISLPLLDEIVAAGSTPEQLRLRLAEAAGKYLEQPNPTVIVKEIHSRSAYITGKVAKPGTYALASGLNVMQLIASAGGLLEYADDRNIVVIRNDAGKPQYHPFDYHGVVNRKHPEQNIVLRPGDIVVVP